MECRNFKVIISVLQLRLDVRCVSDFNILRIRSH